MWWKEVGFLVRVSIRKTGAEDNWKNRGLPRDVHPADAAVKPMTSGTEQPRGTAAGESDSWVFLSSTLLSGD